MDAAAIDDAMMRHALVLARRGLGRTWPNPSVGAVIWRVENSEPVIVGRGFTQPGGRPHAETQALAMAGEAARGASMAVTLEPCAHHGQTPPCADAIVRAGIAWVVSALDDPDPRVNGGGYAILRQAGVEVATGVCTDEARAVTLGFLRKIVDRRPMVTLKLAQTSDGYAGVEGQQLMVSSSTSKHQVHLARAAHDAIMVGVGTVVADNPDLTCRLPGMMPFSPVRIVIDTHLVTPMESRLVATCRSVPTWIITGPDTPESKIAGFRAEGVVVEQSELGADGRLNMTAVLHLLAARGVTRILSEGGPMLAEALVKADVVDAVTVYTSPEPLGREGIVALRPGLKKALKDKKRFIASTPTMSGRDTLVQYTRI